MALDSFACAAFSHVEISFGKWTGNEDDTQRNTSRIFSFVAADVSSPCWLLASPLKTPSESKL